MSNKYIVKEDMICPITKEHCDDECCPVGSECNLSAEVKEEGEGYTTYWFNDEQFVPEWQVRQLKQRIKVYLKEIEDLRKTEKEDWISVESGLPDIDESVLVEAFYLKCGKPVSEIFVGYMDEYGDLYSMPTDEFFGWQFNDVVVRWRKLPTSPKEAEQNDKA